MNLEESVSGLIRWSEEHAVPNAGQPFVSYGTAGFRDKADLLDGLVLRCGAIACLRSKSLGGSAIGLMITASHNPEEDNGVKIVDPNGEMLDPNWEAFVESFANSEWEELRILLNSDFMSSINIFEAAIVVIGHDTRSSSHRLAEAATAGIVSFGGQVVDVGLVTTPQLHFIVKCKNDPSYGVASEEGYWHKLITAFTKLNDLHVASGKSTLRYDRFVTVDCANGVGAMKMAHLRDKISGVIQIRLENTGQGKLNDNCGADFVKLYQKAPSGLKLEPLTRYASFDGDADRIVYFFVPDSDPESLCLLDGDKIAILFAFYLEKMLTSSGLRSQLTFRLIQSAYANGSSTIFAREKLSLETDCVPTGVKHLHSQAKKFDVSVYFEANGHGTVLFSGKAVSLVRETAATGNEFAIQLLLLIDLINQTTGDAISDFLLIETILRNLDWSVVDWNDLYRDLPCRQVKVVVSDRSEVETEDAERRCTKPQGLQDSIDAYVRKFGPNARSFVRPSGTENVVRIYAEAETQEKADALAEAVASRVKELVGTGL